MTNERPRDDLIIGEHYYILASSLAADLPKLVLKHDTAFLVADRRGDFPNIKGEFGFYVDDTRFMSLFELRLHGQRGLMLNAGLSDDALEAAIDLTIGRVREPWSSCPASTRLLRITILAGSSPIAGHRGLRARPHDLADADLRRDSWTSSRCAVIRGPAGVSRFHLGWTARPCASATAASTASPARPRSPLTHRRRA